MSYANAANSTCIARAVPPFKRIATPVYLPRRTERRWLSKSLFIRKPHNKPRVAHTSRDLRCMRSAKQGSAVRSDRTAVLYKEMPLTSKPEVNATSLFDSKL